MKRLILIIAIFTICSISTAFAATIPTLGWPVDKTPAQVVRYQFGYTWPATGSARTRITYRESGIDIKATAGDRVLAAEAGVVKEAVEMMPMMVGSIGFLVIEHTDATGGKYTTFYYHTANIQPLVTIGALVTKGQYLSDVCDLGVSTHLHFGIRNAAYDPAQSRRDYLPAVASGTTPKFPELYVDPSLYLP
jgi:murein DD-endopeptidase MepM/ murein hydrolase activator NlpD